MKRAILLLMCVVLACPAWAIPLEKLQLEICPFGLPQGTKDGNDLVIRDIYVLSANPATKFADWVAYRLDPCSGRGASIDTQKWRADPLLAPENTLEDADFMESEEDKAKKVKKIYDRGHQAPLAAFKGGKSWYKTNYLSNITPQRIPLNQGPWEKLETAERNLALEEVLFVITGTVYERPMPELKSADEKHVVPSGYWKVIVSGWPGKMRAVGFFLDQDTPRRALEAADAVPVNSIEARTGLRFFWRQSAAEESRLTGGIDQEFLNQLLSKQTMKPETIY